MENFLEKFRKSQDFIAENGAEKIMEVVFKHVANGGSLIELCKTWNVRYSDIRYWIEVYPPRNEMFKDAVNAGNEWIKTRLVDEMLHLSSVDLRAAYDENNCLLDIKDMPAEAAKAIAGVEVFEEFQGYGKDREYIGRTKKVRFYDKLKAIELLGKKLAMYITKVEHNVGHETLEALVAKSMQPPPVTIDVTPQPEDVPL